MNSKRKIVKKSVESKSKDSFDRLRLLVKSVNKNIALSLFYLLLLVFIFFKTYGYVYDSKIWLGGDNASYYLTGLSIAQGTGYSVLYMPGTPPANHFPVGYPFIISIIIRLFGESMQVVKSANGFFLLGVAVLLFFVVAELTKNKHLAFIAALLTMLNAHMLSFSFIEMSEMPFTFFSLLSVLLFIKTYRRGADIRHPYFWLLVASLIITFYIRTSGIAEVGAVLFILAINKRWLQTAVLLVGLTVSYTPWMMRSQKLGGNDYVQEMKMINPYRPEMGTITLTGYPKRMLENLDRYASKELKAALTGDSINDVAYHEKSGGIEYFFGVLLILLALTGLFSLKEFRLTVFVLMAGTCFLLLIWPPVWYGIRFILPSVPLLIFLVIAGVHFLLSKSKIFIHSEIVNRYLKFVPFVFVLFLFPYCSNVNNLHRQARGRYPSTYTEYFELAKWCNENLSDTSVICTRKPELFYLFAKRKCLVYPLTSDGKEMFNFFKKNGVTHVVRDNLGFSSSGMFLGPSVNMYIERFLDVKRISHEMGVYQIFYDEKFGYFGEWKNGVREGKGIAKYCDGSVYEGEFHDNSRNGNGKYVTDSTSYIGGWKNDRYEGNGIYYYADKSSFKGEFRNGFRNGEGRNTKADGKYITGRWENDTAMGSAIVFDKNNKMIAKGEWVNGAFVASSK